MLETAKYQMQNNTHLLKSHIQSVLFLSEQTR